jgi:hypothetical protein
MCYVNALVLKNPLAKPQNNPNKRKDQIELFEINLMQFKTTLYKKIIDIKINKPHIEAKWRCGLTH